MPIRRYVLLIILSSVALVATTLLLSQLYFSRDIAYKSTEHSFNLATKNIEKYVRYDFKQIESILKALMQDTHVAAPLQDNGLHPLFIKMRSYLEIKKSIYALYMYRPDGLFFQVINLEAYPQSRTLFNAPKDSRWAVIHQKNSMQKRYFLNSNDDIIQSDETASDFEPTKRVWYENALKLRGVSFSTPYRFSSLKEMGFSYAIEDPSSGVIFGLDKSARRLNEILATQEGESISEVSLYDEKGTILASSEFFENATERSSILNSDAILLKSDKIYAYSIDDKEYFVQYKKTTDDKYIGLRTDAYKALERFYEKIYFALAFALFLLLLLLPVIYWVANKLIQPIKLLIDENNKIQQRQFGDVKAIKTTIKELQELSDSQVAMSKSIQNYQQEQEALLDSIVRLIAEAIDAKSSYTGGHCARVPKIAQMLLEAANESDLDAFKNFNLSDEAERKAYEIGSWLHDCGKVTTPEYVVDKAVKLETIYNRIHEIRTRFEVLLRDAKITYYEALLAGEERTKAEQILHVKEKTLQEEFAFIATCNIGGEYMDEAKQKRLSEIASKEWVRHFDNQLGLGELEKMRYKDIDQNLPAKEHLLSDEPYHIIKRENFDYEGYRAAGFTQEVPEHLYNYGELYNLCIAKGTLTPEERYKINEHVIMSIKMLEKIPFPKEMQKIVTYAGTHHETLDATGYPRSLDANALGIPERIMAIADIFEALSASDRPYKKAKTLSESIKIMSFMCKDKHIDKALFELFLREKIYLQYATQYLNEEQIDEVDIEQYLS